jgi:hypothetical protein
MYSNKIATEFSFAHALEGWLTVAPASRPLCALSHGYRNQSRHPSSTSCFKPPIARFYPLNPKAARAYRDRKAPSGTKSDHLDAWSFADALRLDVSN